MTRKNTHCCKLQGCLREVLLRCMCADCVVSVCDSDLISTIYRNLSNRELIRLAVQIAVIEDFEIDVWVYRVMPMLQYSKI